MGSRHSFNISPYHPYKIPSTWSISHQLFQIKMTTGHNIKERMGGMKDEAIGSIKETVGHMTHNPVREEAGHQQKLVGEARQEVAKTHENIKGAEERAFGRAEQGVGVVAGDNHLKMDGKATEMKGAARQHLN
eukprot:TRINITY_DN662_c1_g2_i1.p1 TRINITY_DN662_c1_g2~~TRINITY_DN662_c1_g2_i1.p1  ORF type:complete len:133 (-),score=35.80 TRINITY_DN662_c1_g2_i1:442-840(-)